MTEVAFASRTVDGVPLLLAMPAERQGPLPLVLWFHGFNATKDAHHPELARVAAAGLLAVGVDVAGHGARRLPDFDARKTGSLDDVRRFMLALASETVAEIPAIVCALADEGLADARRVAVVGISMGGYLVYRAVQRVPAIRTAVAILGSPVWPGYDDSPHLDPDVFRHTALLSVTAGRDANVPPDDARRLHATLASMHPARDDLRYVELADAGHLMSAEQWATAMDETLHWLVAHGR